MMKTTLTIVTTFVKIKDSDTKNILHKNLTILFLVFHSGVPLSTRTALILVFENCFSVLYLYNKNSKLSVRLLTSYYLEYVKISLCAWGTSCIVFGWAGERAQLLTAVVKTQRPSRMQSKDRDEVDVYMWSNNGRKY